MFTVYLYSFSKAENSTARPSQVGLEFSCQLKAPCSVLNPDIVFVNTNGAEWNPTAYTYAYLPAFNRYYFILNWTNSGPAWTASLKVDALATYRDAIGTFQTYVYRSSHAFDTKIKDSQYPCKADIHLEQPLITNLPSPFAYRQTEEPGSTAGPWVLVEVQGDYTAHYLMTFLNFVQFIIALFNDDYYTAVLGEFGATEYPEAKVAINPLQYVTKAKLVVGEKSLYTGAGSISHTSVSVGPAAVTPGGTWECWDCSRPVVKTSRYQFSRPVHPQAQTRGEWLNSDPTTTLYELYVAPFGVVSLPSQDVGLFDTLELEFVVDPWNCNATMRVTALNVEDTATRHVVSEITTALGVDLKYGGLLDMMPGMATITADMASYAAAMSNSTSMGLSSVAGAMFGSPKAIAGVTAAGSEALQAQRDLGAKWTSYLVPHASIGGSSGGSLCNSYYKSYFNARFMPLVDEDNNDFGRPLMAVRRIGDIPGFVMCNPENFSISGYKEELDTVMTYMQGGFHYV